MVFSSNVFLFIFLPIVLLGYNIVGKRARNYWLLFASLFFYSWNQPQFLWIILYCIIINYLGGILISKGNSARKKLIVTIITISLNLLCLFYFKYFNFAVRMIERLTDSSLSLTEVLLPIGISFFTFQGMSYVFDIYRNQVVVQKNPFKFALYIALFPQLVAGPIVRYTEVAREIDDRKESFDNLLCGTRRFIIGLGKKTVIANTMAVVADLIFKASPYENTVPIAWLGIICYTLQIYFDFSGYSDMAIGLGRMFGFHFGENFNYPYISRTISEFWRRWHISLSSWFRDYVYIPLGGNRKHVYGNLIFVFLLTGIWHGAAYQFIAWGMFHGFFIVLERYLRTKVKRINIQSVMAKIFQHVYTMGVVMIGWVFFRAPSMRQGIEYLGSMFGLLKNITPRFDVRWYLDRYTVVVLIVAIILSTPLLRRVWDRIIQRVNETCRNLIMNVGLLGLFIYSLSCIVMSTYNPFIYFQF